MEGCVNTKKKVMITINEQYKESYIRDILLSKSIKDVDFKHYNEKITHVYADNYVYIFNFAKEDAEYIKTSWK